MTVFEEDMKAAKRLSLVNESGKRPFFARNACRAHADFTPSL